MTANASDCILWKGAQHNGYPMIGKRLAHRVAYERDVATIPDGHVLHHTCANPLCVNPEHLVAVTPRDHALLHRAWEQSVAARRSKSHCVNGHPIDSVDGNGKRFCSVCRRATNYRAGVKRRRRAAMILAETVDEQPAEPIDIVADVGDE